MQLLLLLASPLELKPPSAPGIVLGLCNAPSVPQGAEL